VSRSRGERKRAPSARAPRARGGDVIDRAHLKHIAQGNYAFEREILRLFAAHVPTVLDELKRARTRARWAAAAHALKGSALTVGARELARHAERAERLDVREGTKRERALRALAATAEEACSAALEFAASPAEPELTPSLKGRRLAG